MGPVSAEVEIDAPRERIFEFVADLANRQAFTDHFIADLRLTRIEPRGVGASARFRFTSPPQDMWVDSVIVALAAPHRITEEGRGGRYNRIPVHTAWEFEPGTGRMTNARVTYWTETTHPVDRLKATLGGASFWYERDWRTALRRLRDLIEADNGGEARVGVGGGNRYATGVP